MTFQLPEDLSALTPEDLDKLNADALAEYEPLASIADDEITDDQLAELERLGDAVIAIQGAQEQIQAAVQERTDRIAAAKAKVAPAEEPAEEPAEAVAEVPETETVDAVEPVIVPDDASEITEKEKEPVTAAGKPSIVARANGRVATPEVAAEPEAPQFSLIAAADVPGISAGAQYKDWDQVVEAFTEKIEGFIEGTGNHDVLNRYPIAKLKKPVNDTFVSARAGAEEVANAVKAANAAYGLPGTAEGLVASIGGWSAPSQILYDLPVIEDAPDGLLTLPEITVERGGFQHTRGVDLSTVTADSNRAFTQTETQAIAATVKPFLTMNDVTFVDERLDVIGHGLRAKFLTLHGYPELVRRYVQLSNTAYIKYKNADLITRLLAQTFTAATAGSIGSVAQDTIDAIALQARRLRYKFSLKENATFQGIAPIWLKDVIREDLAKRSGYDSTLVSDAQITSLLSSRGLSIQFIRDYAQDLGNSATAYPTTAVIHLWRPGKFVVGGGPVVSFDALYDYASLTTNTFTQFFIEESRLLANMDNSEAVAITVSTAASERYGRTGSYDLGSTHAV